MNSYFTISLDLEKKWGILDKNIPNYDTNIKNVDQVVEMLLNLFSQYGIRATWACVGMLVFDSIEDIKKTIKCEHTVKYSNPIYSPENYLNDFNEGADIELYSAINSLRSISSADGQDVVSHSFFHTYFNEDGVSNNALKDDFNLFNRYFNSRLDLAVSGIVYPRNQVPPASLDNPYLYCRTNLNNFFDRGYSESELNIFIKLARTLDCFLPLRKFRLCTPYINENNKLCIPSTRFFRPYIDLSFVNKLMLTRIKKEMTWAAKNNDYFHLWWHPHNFGRNLNQNLSNLKDILNHYKLLNAKYGMVSASMKDIYDLFRKDI